MSHSEELLERIRAHTARVGVIGLGYVGLPLALLFEEAGFPVVGFDVDPAKPESRPVPDGCGPETARWYVSPACTSGGSGRS